MGVLNPPDHTTEVSRPTQDVISLTLAETRNAWARHGDGGPIVAKEPLHAEKPNLDEVIAHKSDGDR